MHEKGHAHGPGADHEDPSPAHCVRQRTGDQRAQPEHDRVGRDQRAEVFPGHVELRLHDGQYRRHDDRLAARGEHHEPERQQDAYVGKITRSHWAKVGAFPSA